MTSYADDERDGDFVRCDVEACATPHARMGRAEDGLTLVAPPGWAVARHRIEHDGTVSTWTMHACPACVRKAGPLVPTVSVRFVA